MSWSRAALAGATLALCATLSACGFQLRGKVDLPFETVFVEAPAYSKFGEQLKRGIEGGSHTRLTESKANAQAIVSLLGEAQERLILAVSGGGRVRELQLRYRAMFKVTDAKGEIWLPQGEVVILRDMTYDDAQVLAKEAEANQLFREMQADAVQQMLRRIQAIRAASEEEN